MAEQKLEIKLETLTPLWTGGVQAGKMDRLHETGIIGSLRWWYEAIVRGLEGWACDPSRHVCPDKEGNVCDACALFGATGLKRAFRIDWDRPKNEEPDQRLTVKIRNDNRGWFLGRGLFLQNLEGVFRPTRLLDWGNQDEMLQMLALPLHLVNQWGGLGARTQQGYGVLKIETTPDLDIESALTAYNKLQKRTGRQKNKGNNLPKINEFFFARVRFSKPTNPEQFIKDRTFDVNNSELQLYIGQNVLPIAPVVRYYLRGLIRTHIISANGANAPARWQLMGVLNSRYHKDDNGKLDQERWYCPQCRQTWDKKPDRSKHQRCSGRPYKQFRCLNCHQWFGERDKPVQVVQQSKSLLHVSHAYPVDSGYEFRIWGWIPPALPGQVTHDEVIGYLRKWLGVVNRESRSWQNIDSNAELWTTDHVSLTDAQILWVEQGRKESNSDFLQAVLVTGGAL